MKNNKFLLLGIFITLLSSCDDSGGSEPINHLVGSWIGNQNRIVYQGDSLISFVDVPNFKVIFNNDQTGRLIDPGNNYKEFVWIYSSDKKRINFLKGDINDVTPYLNNEEYEILIDRPNEQHWRWQGISYSIPDSIEQLGSIEWIFEKEE